MAREQDGDRVMGEAGLEGRGPGERIIRTIKEQVIHGRVFRNLQEVRQAVRRFVDTHNLEWLVASFDWVV